MHCHRNSENDGAGAVGIAKRESGAKNAEGAFSKDYRGSFFGKYPDLHGLVVVHHLIEQLVLERFPGLITEAAMHSLENLRGIPKELNSTLDVLP